MKRIGSYRVIRSLGAGGMGEVYLAARIDPAFEQQVAVKVVRAGACRSDIASRLKFERQILAHLDHPNIARLIDGGSLDDGTPYIVMEYVDGIPIDAFCDERRLDVRARLKLFQQVCGAVHAAHQGLIVHRDLKPSNILVTAQGVPKLLDFGIAKLLEEGQPAPHTLAVTHADFRLMTPEHASPEQVRGLLITTASDVYVLGVLLYQLLCGAKPFVITSMRLAEIDRAICEDVPALPSEVFSGEPTPDALEIAAARGVTTVRLRKLLSGDLDNIVMMAMRKEPARRYASAQQFASDIQRHLDGRAVIARRDTFNYRAAKFLRRNWLPVTSGCLSFVLLAVFAVTTLLQSRRITAERDAAARQRMVAELERSRAQEVSRFLVDLFKLSDPEQNRGNQVTARELLDSGAQRVRTGLQKQPATKAALLTTVAEVYNSLGLYNDALPILNESLALQPNRHDASRLDALLEQGRARSGAGDLAAAEAPLQSALQLAQQESGANSLPVARALWALGRLRLEQGSYLQAQHLLDQALSTFESNRASPTDVSWLLDDLAQVDEREQRWDLARSAYLRALAIDRLNFGDDHPRVGVHLHNLAVLAQQTGDVETAQRLYPDVIRRYEHAYGTHHPETAAAWGNYGLLLDRIGQYPQSEALLRRALDVTQSLYGPDHFLVGYRRVSLGMVLQDEGHFDAAEQQYRRAIAIYDKILSPTHAWRAAALTHLATLLLVRGRSREALDLSAQAIRIWDRDAAEKSSSGLLAHAVHGFAEFELARSSGEGAPGSANGGAAELRAATDTLVQTRGNSDPAAARARLWLAETNPTGSTMARH